MFQHARDRGRFLHFRVAKVKHGQRNAKQEKDTVLVLLAKERVPGPMSGSPPPPLTANRKQDLSVTITGNWLLPTTWMSLEDKSPAQLAPWLWPWESFKQRPQSSSSDFWPRELWATMCVLYVWWFLLHSTRKWIHHPYQGSAEVLACEHTLGSYQVILAAFQNVAATSTLQGTAVLVAPYSCQNMVLSVL